MRALYYKRNLCSLSLSPNRALYLMHTKLLLPCLQKHLQLKHFTIHLSVPQPSSYLLPKCLQRWLSVDGNVHSAPCDDGNKTRGVMKSHKAQINGCFIPHCCSYPFEGGEEHNQSMKLVFQETFAKLHPRIDKAGGLKSEDFIL